ncbi:MAG: hypothetical protein ACE5IJ_00610 [Thermoplasmata archaeon]
MKLLNFDLDRRLGFNPDRDLTFSLNRNLIFDVDRELSFDLDRDLGFGKKGVIFRGYVCSSCGALVGPMATRCDECGVTFQAEPRKETAKKAQSKRRFCHYCGYPISGPDTYCSHCGLKLSSGSAEEDSTESGGKSEEFQYDLLKLQKREERRKTLTDWRETGKEFEDFLEK